MAASRNDRSTLSTPAPLGSLVTARRAELPTCEACGSARVTAIAMTLTDGSEVDFLSCHACEHRTWTQGGNPLELPSVLAKAQKHKP